jgi:hypothetical protein
MEKDSMEKQVISKNGYSPMVVSSTPLDIGLLGSIELL